MKILYVTTISNTVNTFLIPHIKMLINDGHQVDVAFKVEQEVKQELIDLGCKVYNVSFERSPLRVNNIKAYKIIKNIIVRGSYNLVHTHTPIASAIVRMACINLNSVKVFYTAHGFHFYKGADLINWLFYYPVEKWLSKHTNTLITLNREDYKRAKMKFNIKKIRLLPGVGINVKEFDKLKINKSLKTDDIGISEDSFILLSVGELNNNKNHKVVLNALAKIQYNNIHYVICGQGKSGEKLKRLTKKLNIEKQVHFIGYRNDIGQLCKSSDLFIFPSFREGLSVALMEAMACGLPVLCSNIRGNSDLIIEGRGGFLFNPHDEHELSIRLKELISKKTLRKEFGLYNRNVIKQYDLSNVINSLRQIYKDEINE